MSYYKWSEAEEDYLEAYINSGEFSDFEVASKYLGIPIEKIQSKAHYMRAVKHRNTELRRRYTDKETDFIAKYYGVLETSHIAERLGRSVESVREKAKNIGVSKSSNIRQYDDLIRAMADNGHTRREIAQRIKVDRKSVDNYIRLNGIQCRYVTNEERTKEYKKIITAQILN
ncbi:hypothetical protein ACW66K_06855 [Aerococcus urinaeequi]